MSRSPRRAARLWLGSLAASEIELTRDDAHYVRDVLRLNSGDQLEVFDGAGRRADASVSRSDRRGVCLTLSEPSQVTEPGLFLTVGLACPKGERADWTVEKLTELGVRRIVWLRCERGVVTPKEAGRRAERHARIMHSAARQCGSYFLPRLHASVSLAELLGEPADVRYVAEPGGAPPAPLLPTPQTGRVLLLVGPEGGFTDQELEAARAGGCRALRLHRNILRVETAAVVGAALLTASLDS